ncbi:OmpA family protein [Rathayibacter sp. AY1E8]|uniref:OmpA family protein n=1 Tax=Rathayibacter sp. AY1E8 TaxID=2080555 RepID=UPI0011B0BD0F|nr:OmpA family protein [Rathayibacter sp. AY1E8]
MPAVPWRVAAGAALHLPHRSHLPDPRSALGLSSSTGDRSLRRGRSPDLTHTTNERHTMTFRTRGTVLVLALAAAVGLSGCTPGVCTDDGDGVDQLAVIVGNRSNSALATADQLGDALATINAPGDRITVIAADGVPDTIYDFTLSEPPENDLDARDARDAFESDVDTAIAVSTANDPEVDQTEAIALATRNFSDSAATRTIVFLDSGVQTTGDFAMLDGALYNDPNDRVQSMRDAGALADLEGIHVQMPMLGLTQPPQEPLTEDAYQALVAQWTAFVSAAGGTLTIGGASSAPSPQAAPDLPNVTPVSIDRPTATAGKCAWTLEDGAIGFVADEATLLSEDAAKATVAAAVQALSGCAGAYTVIGSTSSAKDQTVNLPLSTDRATTVAGLVAKHLGLPVESITIKGFGEEWTCRVNDRGPDGALLAEQAALNRVVVISRGTIETSCKR